MARSSSNIRRFAILLAGLLLGTLAGQLLGKAFHLGWLTDAWTPIDWHPAGDLVFVKYDLDLQVKLNLASLIGLVLGWWISKNSR
ncbi:DUF4321 domain-containing protein [Effusibacillus dendaii]|uniref:DUF4321 domain-containing protein n=1 Tax=Effusibacillus dendaii TaxID=2743772 RepID=A0A7I8D973_9BACL|nr:DUF4321 domain-containing protein [Effusibacillus dendaii]BCJ85070.1 hypothetical protein skT53_00550 [Effusibacillus dendaii]